MLSSIEREAKMGVEKITSERDYGSYVTTCIFPSKYSRSILEFLQKYKILKLQKHIHPKLLSCLQHIITIV